MEGLEKTKTFVRQMVDEVRHANLALGQMEVSGSALTPEQRRDVRWAGYLERANAIIEGRVDETRYKILTLGQLNKSNRRHFVGKDGEQSWNDGERVLAFEDGTLAFKESGADLWGTLAYPEDLAAWIGLLDGFPQRWESGPSSNLEAVQIH